MAPAGLLIVAGTLAVMATSMTIGLEIVLCANAAGNTLLINASIAAATVEAAALVMLAALGSIKAVKHNIPYWWSESSMSFVVQLLMCTAAAAISIAALVVTRQSTTEPHDDTLVAFRRNILVGLAMALSFAAVFQIAFVTSYFIAFRHAADGSSSPSSPSCPSHDHRKKHVKGIRYSQTMPMLTVPETTPGKKNQPTVATHQKIGKDPIECLRTSITKTVCPTPSRSKLLGLEQRRPMSLESALESGLGSGVRSEPESAAPVKIEELSFDSWDTSAVDEYNRQVVMELSSPTAVKKAPEVSLSEAVKKALELSSPEAVKEALRKIAASPLESLPASRPTTPLIPDCPVPPPMVPRTQSKSPSIRSHCEASILTPGSYVNEMDIHPLFRSYNTGTPPLVSPGTSVLAAPHAGMIIPRNGSLQSLINPGAQATYPTSPTRLYRADWNNRRERTEAENHHQEKPVKDDTPHADSLVATEATMEASSER
ncbi:hypothetical protein E4U13_001845 [Claviceps humidiphila]|uniref:Uncharacterized protein n=1 Tax=Claviceps humidiphila TaxID=1294629 RepID=A0A9P7Q0M5_9HYPO|nr:hypothetical protein E4U13_001845 [Claviceps humidiphila]